MHGHTIVKVAQSISEYSADRPDFVMPSNRTVTRRIKIQVLWDIFTKTTLKTLNLTCINFEGRKATA